MSKGLIISLILTLVTLGTLAGSVIGAAGAPGDMGRMLAGAGVGALAALLLGLRIVKQWRSDAP